MICQTNYPASHTHIWSKPIKSCWDSWWTLNGQTTSVRFPTTRTHFCWVSHLRFPKIAGQRNNCSTLHPPKEKGLSNQQKHKSDCVSVFQVPSFTICPISNQKNGSATAPVRHLVRRALSDVPRQGPHSFTDLERRPNRKKLEQNMTKIVHLQYTICIHHV